MLWFKRFSQILSSVLFLLLLGQAILLIVYWSLGTVPSKIDLLNILLVLLILICAAALFITDSGRVDEFYRFCSSGLFFMLLGLVFLFLAHWSMGTAHAGLTFVLVVLGVAVLLYGTGTQGMGQLQGGESQAKYNVAIAGGAGVLAFCVALGIIWYSPDMRVAFQTERKFVRLLIKSFDGFSSIPSFVPTFEVDGTPIPAIRHGNVVEVFVPYTLSNVLLDEITKKTEAKPTQTPGEDVLPTLVGNTKAFRYGVCPDPENVTKHSKLRRDAGTKTVSAMFYRIDPKADSQMLTAPADFTVTLDYASFDHRGGGQDYPYYPVLMCINLQSSEAVDRVAANSSSERPMHGKEAPRTGVDASLGTRVPVQ